MQDTNVVRGYTVDISIWGEDKKNQWPELETPDPLAICYTMWSISQLLHFFLQCVAMICIKE